MTQILGAAEDVASGAPLAKATTTAAFATDVLAESGRQPVLVDFWAPWCEPCKQLAPVLEKAVQAAEGKVKLVTMNIDEHPQIAGQLGIRSIPAVVAFQKGQPLDGFMGALPEGQIKAFLDKHLPSEDELDALAQADEAQQLLAEGSEADAGTALEKLAQAVEQAPENDDLRFELVRQCISHGLFEPARAALAPLRACEAKDALVELCDAVVHRAG